MTERHIIRVRQYAPGRWRAKSDPASRVGIKLPSDWVSKVGLKFDDLIITIEEDGYLKLMPLKDKGLLSFVKDLGVFPERGRPTSSDLEHPAKTRERNRRKKP